MSRRIPMAFAFVSASVLLALLLTGFAGLLIKRTIKGSVLGNSFEISDEQVQQIAAAGAVAGVAAATAVTQAPFAEEQPRP